MSYCTDVWPLDVTFECDFFFNFSVVIFRNVQRGLGARAASIRHFVLSIAVVACWRMCSSEYDIIHETMTIFLCCRSGPRAPSRRMLRKVTSSAKNLRGESVPISTRSWLTQPERYSRKHGNIPLLKISSANCCWLKTVRLEESLCS